MPDSASWRDELKSAKSDVEKAAAKDLLRRYDFENGAIDALLDFHCEQNDLESFPFPWEGAERFLTSHGRNAIRLIGYGSLMNPVSAARSIAETPSNGHPPVVAIGVKRVFNYKMPDSVFTRYGHVAGEWDRAGLNAEPAIFEVINGRVIEVGVTDLPALRLRERAYDLHPVSCLSWNAKDDRPFAAYALCCRHEYFEGVRYLDDRLLPYMPYAKVCRDGAGMVSPQFLEMYLRTAFMADRSTTVEQWEAELGGG